MAVTLISICRWIGYPVWLYTREPFAMTFPIETTEDAQVQARVIEATPDRRPATARRCAASWGCMLSSTAMRPLDAVIDGAAARRPAGARLRTRLAGPGGIPLGEAKRARRGGTHPAGKDAMLAFRK